MEIETVGYLNSADESNALASAPSHHLVDENGRLRSKSSNRMFYEAQVQVIQKQIGNLEKIRQDLGLSQRKISQLLLVDPSAWTRWVKSNEEAPPHIYRALQWYMTLQEKIPGLTPQYFISRDLMDRDRKALKDLQKTQEKRAEFEEAFATQTLRLEEMIEALRKENAELKLAVKHNRWGFVLMALGGIIFALAFYWRYLG